LSTGREFRGTQVSEEDYFAGGGRKNHFPTPSDGGEWLAICESPRGCRIRGIAKVGTFRRILRIDPRATDTTDKSGFVARGVNMKPCTVRTFRRWAKRSLALATALAAGLATEPGFNPLFGQAIDVERTSDAWAAGGPSDEFAIGDGPGTDPDGRWSESCTFTNGSLTGGEICPDGPGVDVYGMTGPCVAWTWRTEALALWRTAPSSRPIFANASGGQLAGTALDAKQLESDPLAAPRLSLFRDNGCGRILEANYLWAGNFYSDRTLPFVRNGYATSPPGIYGNQWGPDLDTSLNAAEATLLANLQTAELNIRERFLRDLAQFLIGFRWLQWNESLAMQDSFSTPPAPAPVTAYGTDFYQTECFNNLYGGQIGIEANLLGSQSGYRVDGLVKAGAFYNDATQRSSYAYADTSPFEFSASNRVGSPDGAAFVGEVGMTAVIPVHCNLDLRLGYFGLWIESIAQPANQLTGQNLTSPGTGQGSLDLTGGVVVQGLSLGLEGRW
jgi:hypothetical protein